MNWSNFKHHDIYTDWLESSDTVKAVAQRHEVNYKTANRIIEFGLKNQPKKIVVEAKGERRFRPFRPYGILVQYSTDRSTV